MHLVGFITKKIVTMHGHTNIKFVNATQAKETYQYRNTKEKLYETKAAIRNNKICRDTTYTIAECTVNKLLLMSRGTVRNM